jgi:putative transposase
MSIHISAESIQGKERKEIIEQVQTQIKEAVVQATRQVVMACLEAEVSAQLGREKGSRRRECEQPRQSDWKCGHCGNQDANQFTRDGHYQRTLETKFGHIDHLQIPMLECQNCHHDVICHFSMLDKFQRYWIDMQQDAFFSSGLGQSLRAITNRWSGELERPVGLRSLNELINQVEPLVHRMREQHFPEAPIVIQCDGIWVTVVNQEEEMRFDKRQRKRHRRQGKDVVILVAMGYWAPNRREILDWQLANSEDSTEWEVLLKRLKERGVGAEQGLKMLVRDGCGGLGKALVKVYSNSILDQRCIFHKLKNVADKASTDFKGKEQRREKKKELMEQAAHIYEAEHADMARERLHAWTQEWQSQAPLAVATLERDFEDTLAYYQLDTVRREWIRTTSLLERTNRELRRKFRQAVTFGSSIGADVALFLQVKRLHARWTDVPWWQVSHDLSFELHP